MRMNFFLVVSYFFLSVSAKLSTTSMCFCNQKIINVQTQRISLYFSSLHFQTFEDSDLFHLIGVICGLAIYNFTIVDLHFPLALYKKLLKKKPSLDDLKELMPDVGRLVVKVARVEFRKQGIHRKLSFQDDCVLLLLLNFQNKNCSNKGEPIVLLQSKIFC